MPLGAPRPRGLARAARGPHSSAAMARVLEFRFATREAVEVSPAGFEPDPGSDRVYWLRLAESEADELRELAPGLGLDEEELDYLTEPDPIPGLVERDEALQLTLFVQDADGSGTERSLRLTLAERFCLVVVAGRVGAIEEFEESCGRELRFAKTSNFMLFLVLDAVVDRFARTVARVDGECEALGDRIYANPKADHVPQILELKRKVIALKRELSHVREILMRLSGRRMGIVNDATREALHEVYDHAQAMLASAESLRELVSSYMDATMSMQQHRMNETIKILTLFASILMPMTLIAGIWGMNFKHMPETQTAWGYPLAVAVIAGCGLLTYAWFKRRRLI